ncbi:S-antigen protein [Mizuhopecten yessoensis]|uniref:S-antigen protein n=1 Tax=Mizuhopecten yessoensis TaxID=6573 RepID=A0A210QLJ0_MIZYE|nr:S-antigen protein [Mizuhopecten yessoensis]
MWMYIWGYVKSHPRNSSGYANMCTVQRTSNNAKQNENFEQNNNASFITICQKTVPPKCSSELRMKDMSEGAKTVEYYREIGERVADTLQKYNNDTEGWEESKSTTHFKISYRKSTEFQGYLYKGEAVYAAKPKVVFDYVEPLPNGHRAKWDKNMKKIEIIKQMENDLRINRACTNSACMGLISPRDFVDLILIKETDEYLSTNAISIEHSDCPADEGHVRGHNYSCGMIVCKYPNIEGELEEQKKYVRGWNYQCGIIVVKLPSEPNKCKLISLIQPEIKGMVPAKLKDAAIPGSMIEFFTQLRDTLKEAGELHGQD